MDKSHGKKTSHKYDAKAVYEEYLEGGGYDMEKSWPESKKNAMDSLFKPSKENMTLYRGGDILEFESMLKENGWNQKEINELIKSQEVNKEIILKSNHYKSTSEYEEHALDYMNEVYDNIEYGWNAKAPVLFEYHVQKDTPIIKRKDIASTNARGGSGEVTIGRKNVEMRLEYVDYDYGRNGEIEYRVGFMVRPRKNK